MHTLFFLLENFYFFSVGWGWGAVSWCRVVVPCAVRCGRFFGWVPPWGWGCEGCEGKDPKGTPYALRASLWPKPLLHSPRIFCAMFVVCFLYTFRVPYSVPLYFVAAEKIILGVCSFSQDAEFGTSRSFCWRFSSSLITLLSGVPKLA